MLAMSKRSIASANPYRSNSAPEIEAPANPPIPIDDMYMTVIMLWLCLERENHSFSIMAGFNSSKNNEWACSVSFSGVPLQYSFWKQQRADTSSPPCPAP